MDAMVERARRRALGAWATPEWLVDRVLDTMLADVAPPRSVLDPACGDGRFLAAAARRWPAAELYGVDVDGDALASARVALGSAARLQRGDGLTLVHERSYDLVVGNPPYLGQLARTTSRGGRSPLGGGPYADTAALFLTRAVELLEPAHGALALVLPRSVLATRDVADIRSRTAAAVAIDGLWIDDEGVFDADVRTIVLSCRAGRRQGDVRRWVGHTFAAHRAAPLPDPVSWSPLIADVEGVPDVRVDDGVARLGALATATADFRDQFYGLVGAVADDGDGPPLVTSGLVDLGACAWGTRTVRFAGDVYRAPRVRLTALEPRLQAWAQRRLVAKVLVATQTSVLEACADEAGAWLPGVPVISLVPRRADDVWPVAAALCSPVASAWAAQLTMGAGLSPTALRLRASQVADVPLPARPWHSAIDALRARDVEGFGRAMNAAYEVDDAPLLAWWLPRALRAARVSRGA